MTDLDAIKRTLADLEKRLTALESRERKAPMTFGPSPARDDQWCECGRDGCRWPYCKSSKAADFDPLGR